MLNNIILCSVRYSDNLGDGVIADCAEYVIRNISPHQNKISHIDLAGRREFRVQATPSTLKTVFYSLPLWLRPLAVLLSWPQARWRLHKTWIPQLRAGGSLIFVGGQILSDVALNFPLKFSSLISLVARQKVRVAVGTVGVSSRWSVVGRFLFRKAISNPSVYYVSVRDVESKAALHAHLGASQTEVNVGPDLGIWAGEVYGIKAYRRNGPYLRIGLGLTSPDELAAQLNRPKRELHSQLTVFWTELAGRLAAQGYQPIFFTNGSAEDEVFKREVLRAIPDLKVGSAERPTVPAELVGIIAGLDAVVSHRLHASIVAYSLGVPAVSLVADPKVRSFCQMVGRERCCYELATPADKIVNDLPSISFGPEDEAKRATLRRRTQLLYAELLRKLER